MTGKELIIYILTHDLTDTEILSENMFLGFPTLSEVAVHNKCGLATIDAYIETREPLDKAGAYTIQAGGALFVKRIEGDFYTIMGLPIGEINQLLKGNDW